MTEEPEKLKCDIDDILCQVQVLGHLKGLESVLGDERFRTRFPEFEGLSQKVTDSIDTQDESLKEALKRCGLPVPEETIVEEATPTVEPLTEEE